MASQHERFTYKQLCDYLASIAGKSKLINSFAERDHEEILEDIDQASELPAMVIDPPTCAKTDLHSSNPQDAWEIVFEILEYHSTKASTVSGKKQLISTCKYISDQVLSYLRRESQQNRLPGFDTADVSGAPIMYESDGYVGWECKIIISVPIDLSYKSDNWNE